MGLKPSLRAVPMPPMVSRMMVPSTTMSQLAALSLDICEEKSVAPRLKVVVSTMVMPTALRPSSAPRCTSRPNSSSWYMEQIFWAFFSFTSLGTAAFIWSK